MKLSIEENRKKFDDKIKKILYFLENNMKVSDEVLTKVKKRIKDCKFYYYDARVEGSIKYNYNKEERSITLEPNEGKTLFIPSDLGEDQLACIVRSDSGNSEMIENNIFNTIIYAMASEQISKDEYRIGFLEIKNKSGNLKLKHEKLNSCIVRIIAKYIYDNLYAREYNLVYDNIPRFKYIRSYFYLYFLIGNAFEENPSELFEAYINNDLSAFKKLLKDKLNMSFFELENVIIDIENIPKNKFFDSWVKAKIYTRDSLDPLKNIYVRKQYEYFLKKGFK